MNQDFKNNALSWGDGGQKWLDSIPSLIATYEKKWNLAVKKPFDLSYNYVAPAVDENGNQCVIKIGYPEDKEFKTELLALSIFNGNKSVRLIKKVDKDSVALLEHVQPGKVLSEVSDDEKATKILCGVIKKLHTSLPENHPFPTVKDWVKAFTLYRKRGLNAIPVELVDEAERLFQELITTSSDHVLCHGDLHHDNILSSDRCEWLAIDPKGVAAEPAYEVAAMIRNPYRKLNAIENLDNILKTRIHILASELGYNPQRIYQWCFAQTVLSGLWSVEGGAKTPDHAIKVASVLHGMKDHYE